MRRRSRSRWAAVTAAAMAAALLPSAYAWAGPGGQDTAATAKSTERPPTPEPSANPSADAGDRSGPVDSGPSKVEKPDGTLPKGWRTSDDRAVTVAGDPRGLHLLVAESSEAYQWREIATLREDGFDADAWIGNVCVTGSGKRAVVAYAPRTFTNEPALFDRGAFAAVVDLADGKVTKLREQVSLAYFNPGCGTDETVVLSQFGDESVGRTRLLRLDAATGEVTRTQTVPGEATSAVPVEDGIVAAFGDKLTRIAADGRRKVIGETSGPAFRLHPDADGGVGFLDREGDRVDVRRTTSDGKISTLAHGRLGQVGLAGGTGGRLFLTGDAEDVTDLPASIKRLDVAADAQVSSHGRLAVRKAVSAGLRTHGSPDPLADRADEGIALPYRVEAEVPQTGEKVEFTVPGRTASTLEKPSPALRTASPAGAGGSGKQEQGTRTQAAGSRPLAAVDSSSTTYDPEATCGVPRNHPGYQALQPTPNQVEWAVDMAIRGNLTSGWITQGGWRSQAGLGSSVSPSSMFPLPELKDAPAGSRIPAQVLLGVLAQESNLWQSTHHVLPGQTGSPLIGNFYGTNIYPGTPGYDPDKYWTINWDEADCGYGMGQQTDGMSSASRQQPGKPAAFPADQQRAIALDYTANVAVAAQTLSKKWNELHTDGQRVEINDDDPRNIENWFAAVWNYNLGFNTPDSEGKWGLGWLNNPANPKYPADRNAFLDNNSYADAAHPQDWPYPEKVMGWAAFPIDTGRAYSDSGEQNDSNTHGYQAAWWNSALYRTTGIKPPLNAFCNDTNDCDDTSPPDCTTLDCFEARWYDGNAKWKTCSGDCGFETLTYKTLRSELGRGDSGTPTCSTSGLPSNALIIDDVADSVPTMRTDCGKSWTNAGRLEWEFAPTAPNGTDSTVTTYEGKEDFHQVGGGFGSHFWFAHTRNGQKSIDKMRVTGTWKLDRNMDQWARVLVHLPDTGAHTQQARYRIDLGDGSAPRERYVNTNVRTNKWVSLGVYRFDGVPSVVLDNETTDGTADNDIAWDAVAFQPLAAKPQHVVAVLGDSYTSGEGAGAYSPESDKHHGTADWNGCRRSDNAWARKIVLPGQSAPLGELSDDWSTNAELGFVACSGAMTKNVAYVPSGNSPQNHNEGQFREVRQVDSGVLDDSTTLVMLTLGGNDENGFANAMQECGNITDCSDDSGFLTEKKAIVDRMVADLEYVMTDIAGKAPNATVMLMGYPELLSRTVKCAGSWYYDMPEVAALAELVNYANAEQREMVDRLRTGPQKYRIQYADPVSAFVGHGGCDDPEWINKIVIGPNGEGDFHAGDPASQACTWEWLGGDCLSRESFHPKDAGTTGYAAVMRQRLDDIGYVGS
ncbi:SGNH/GDSL hydrolase family protein [Streptomyces atrovirens]|uniref:SGNH/GDSL hydrolase family protein n=2 Tax=Streptomyces atrovirens TaxID=285556 RepID=A0ABW0DT51_9ACTN